MATAEVLRVAVVIGCHADVVTHSLVRVGTVDANFSRTDIDADTGQIPLETGLSTVVKQTTRQTGSGSILSPRASVGSSRRGACLHAHCADILSIVLTTVDCGTE